MRPSIIADVGFVGSSVALGRMVGTARSLVAVPRLPGGEEANGDDRAGGAPKLLAEKFNR